MSTNYPIFALMKYQFTMIWMKRIGLVLMIGMLGVKGYGQIPTWEWARDGVGGGDETNMASDDSGNVYLTGEFQDTIYFGAYMLTAHVTGGSTNTFIVKYNSSGDVIWANCADDSANVLIYGVAADNFGNVYTTGFYGTPTVTFGSYTLTNSGQSAIFIVKYNSVGTVVWAKGIGGTGSDIDQGYALTTDRDGNIYVTGDYNSPSLTFDTHTINNFANGTNIFIVKYNPSGNAIWARSAGGNGSIRSYDIICNSSANLYVTGDFYTSFVCYFGSDSVFDTGGGWDFFLAKYDSAGNILWTRNGIGGNDNCQSVASDAQGNSFVAGSFSGSLIIGFDTLIDSSIGYGNPFIVKYDSTGNILWARNGVGYAYGNNWVITDADGNVYLTGGMEDTIITFDTITLIAQYNSYNAMFIVKYNSSGHAVYGFTLASGGDDYNNIANGPSGSIYIGGDFQYISPFIFSADSLFLTGGETPFVAKFNSLTEGTQEIRPQQTISLYPNPNNGTFTLSYSQLSIPNSQFEIIDVLGRTVYTHYIYIEGKETIDVSGLSNGVYFYQLINNTETCRGKFVKAN